MRLVYPLLAFVAFGGDVVVVLPVTLIALWLGFWVCLRRMPASFFVLALGAVLACLVLGIAHIAWASSVRGKVPGPPVGYLLLCNAVLALPCTGVLAVLTALINLALAPLKSRQ